jgi:hypothetical protein
MFRRFKLASALVLALPAPAFCCRRAIPSIDSAGARDLFAAALQRR